MDNLTTPKTYDCNINESAKYNVLIIANTQVFSKYPATIVCQKWLTNPTWDGLIKRLSKIPTNINKALHLSIFFTSPIPMASKTNLI